MRVTAIQNFHPLDLNLARPIRPGEVLEAPAELAREWLGLGFVRVANEAEEQAILFPTEAAVTGPQENAMRKPRENAARRTRKR